MSNNRRNYSKSEKLEIVNEYLEDMTPSVLRELAERYAVHPHTIHRWRRELTEHSSAAFPGNGNATVTEEQKEILRLKKQLREAELHNEILKKAMGIITSPSRKNLLS